MLSCGSFHHEVSVVQTEFLKCFLLLCSLLELVFHISCFGRFEMDEVCDCADKIFVAKPQKLRLMFARRDSCVLQRMLTQPDVIDNVSNGRNFARRCHDVPGEDQGYTAFYDAIHDRHIYISRKDVGLSKAFHVEKEIRCFFNVLSPNATHESYISMSSHTKQWLVTNMRYVAIQMYDAVGNVVIFCYNGRSRSPMYLVAYLILFYDLSYSDARECVSSLLQDDRCQLLDRNNDFGPACEDINNNDML